MKELFKYYQFQKFLENFCLRRNQFKIQLICGNAHDSWCTVFQNQFQFVTGRAFSFHFRLFNKISICAVQNTNEKFESYLVGNPEDRFSRDMVHCLSFYFTFRKLENMQPWQFVSFICTKWIPWTSITLSVYRQNKKISNDQELIQSDPTPRRQNQKGNN